jgi:hypothetical protein
VKFAVKSFGFTAADIAPREHGYAAVAPAVRAADASRMSAEE